MAGSSVFGQWSDGPLEFEPGGVIRHASPDAPVQAAPRQPTRSAAPGFAPDLGPPPSATGPALDLSAIPSTLGGGGGGGGFAPDFGGNEGGTGDNVTASFDDGGVVPATGAPAGPVDPMSVVKGALAFGRSQMGLPSNFSTGQSDEPQQSFADGGVVGEDEQGVVPDEGGVTAGGNKPVDPRSAIRYLTGDMAVDPGIVSALEKRVDPQGSLDPSARVMASIAAAPSPEAAFGIMQHYRSKYNAYSGAARAAFDQGNLGGAAQHATQAFANVPTGHKVKFAPARGGVAVMAEKFLNSAQGGQQQEQSFADGGLVGEDDEEEGVIPAPTQDLGAEPNQEPQPSQDEGPSAPVILSPEQFKNMMSAGYDKPLDEGWLPFVQSLLSNVNPVGSAQAAPQQQQAASQQTPEIPEGANGGEAGGMMGGVLGQVGKLVGGGGQDVAAAFAADGGPDDGGASMGPKGNLGQQSVVPKTSRTFETTNYRQAAQQRQQPQPQAGGAPAQQPDLEAMQEKYMRLANKLFPWVSQEAQRGAYVAHAMEKEMERAGKVDVAKTVGQGRAEVAQTNQQGRAQTSEQHDQRVTQRHDATLVSRERIAQLNQLTRTWSDQQKNQVRMLGQQLMADPTLAKDPAKASARVNQLAQQLGVNRNDIADMIRTLQPDYQAPNPQEAPAQARPPAAAIQLLKQRGNDPKVRRDFAAKYPDWVREHGLPQ